MNIVKDTIREKNMHKAIQMNKVEKVVDTHIVSNYDET